MTQPFCNDLTCQGCADGREEMQAEIKAKMTARADLEAARKRISELGDELSEVEESRQRAHDKLSDAALDVEPHQKEYLKRVLRTARDQTGLAWELSAIDALVDHLELSNDD